MKNTYMSPELLITLIDIKDVLTLSGNNEPNQPENDPAATDDGAMWID